MKKALRNVKKWDISTNLTKPAQTEIFGSKRRRCLGKER
jgi:hypothetical protein